MTAPNNKPLTFDELARFCAYKRANDLWGVFHVILDDKNLEDCCARDCLESAEQRGDPEEIALAQVLVRLSRTQRAKLITQVNEVTP